MSTETIAELVAIGKRGDLTPAGWERLEKEIKVLQRSLSSIAEDLKNRGGGIDGQHCYMLHITASDALTENSDMRCEIDI